MPGVGEEAGPVLHPPAPGLHQRRQLADVAFSQVGQGSLQVRPYRLSVVTTMQVAMDGGCEHADYRQGGPVSAGRAGQAAAVLRDLGVLAGTEGNAPTDRRPMY